MVVIAEALIALDERPRCVPASAWPGSLDGLDSPGLYAWWVDAAGAGELSDGLGEDLPAGRIYVGQAGAASSRAGLPSASTLRSRVTGDHLGGRVRSSTLRRTLASVLLVPLRLDLVGPRRLSAASEARLSDWMQDHLSVAVYAVDSGEHLAELEKCLVAALRPPLNVEHMLPSPMRSRLQELRAIVLHGIDDLWAAPDPELTDWRSILGEYGEAFDGYRYARLVRRSECADVADEVWGRRAEAGRFESPFADLRCALFWLQRCVHSNEQTCDWAPSAELVASAYRLYEAIQETWQREWGAAR